MSPVALQVNFLPAEPSGKPAKCYWIGLDRTKGLVGILNRTKCLLTTVITIIRSEGREQFLENRCKSLNFCRNSLEKMDAEEKKSNNNYTFQYSACTPT